MNFRDLLCRLLGSWGPTPSPVPTPTPVPTPSLPATPGVLERQAVIALFNAQRQQNGRPGNLVELDRLDGWAQWWAGQQATDRWMRHGSGFQHVEEDFRGKACGEIVAMGYRTVPALVAGWMNSPDHRREILGDFDHAGIGWAFGSDGNPYFCANFVKLGAPPAPGDHP